MRRPLLVACLCVLPVLGAPLRAAFPPFDPEQLRSVGRRIALNETGGRPEHLVWWNPGEGFASLGIGHFIWYPEGHRERFEESFPKLLIYLRGAGHPLPAWLATDPPPACPWPDRAAYLAARQDPRMVDLHALLGATVGLQSAFMAGRLEGLGARLRASAGAERRGELAVARLERLLGAPNGLYAVLDYLNFKGEGTSGRERYRGQGWGLLQVLEAMPGDPRLSPGAAFAEAVGRVLRRRVANAPPARHEERWLSGWLRRAETYRDRP